MGGEERFLGGALQGTGKLNVNGLLAFVVDFAKSSGGVQRLDITDGDSEHGMEQSGRKNLPEYTGTLMVPATGYQAYVDAYREKTILTTFTTTLDSPTYLGQFGNYEIIDCNWSAAVRDNDVVTVSITIKANGYGTTTDVTP